MEEPQGKTQTIPILEIALVMVATFFLFLFVSVMAQLSFGTGPTLIIGELLILSVPLVYLLMKRIDAKSYVRIDANPKSILIGIGFAGVLLLLNIIISAVLTYLLGTSEAVEESNRILASTSSTPLGLAMVGTSLILAGICEEFAFRGFLQNSIARKYSAIPAAVIAALVFGLFHFDPQGVYIIAAFTTGLLLGYVYYRWNYTAAVIAHAGMNVVVLVLLLLGV